MAIKNGKPNPLNYFDLRRTSFPAKHFHFQIISKYSPVLLKSIDRWIYQNLNGRYYVGQALSLDNTNTIIHVIKIGFEQDKELSFFNIACPHLN
jgi:hypothetical protein